MCLRDTKLTTYVEASTVAGGINGCPETLKLLRAVWGA